MSILKLQAAYLRGTLAKAGVSVPVSLSLELLASAYAVRNWQALRASPRAALLTGESLVRALDARLRRAGHVLAPEVISEAARFLELKAFLLEVDLPDDSPERRAPLKTGRAAAPVPVPPASSGPGKTTGVFRLSTPEQQAETEARVSLGLQPASRVIGPFPWPGPRSTRGIRVNRGDLETLLENVTGERLAGQLSPRIDLVTPAGVRAQVDAARLVAAIRSETLEAFVNSTRRAAPGVPVYMLGEPFECEWEGDIDIDKVLVFSFLCVAPGLKVGEFLEVEGIQYRIREVESDVPLGRQHRRHVGQQVRVRV